MIIFDIFIELMCTSDNFTFYFCTPCTFMCYIFAYISLSLSFWWSPTRSHTLKMTCRYIVAILLLLLYFSPGPLLQHIVLVQMAAFGFSMVAVVLVGLAQLHLSGAPTSGICHLDEFIHCALI